MQPGSSWVTEHKKSPVHTNESNFRLLDVACERAGGVAEMIGCVCKMLDRAFSLEQCVCGIFVESCDEVYPDSDQNATFLQSDECCAELLGSGSTMLVLLEGKVVSTSRDDGTIMRRAVSLMLITATKSIAALLRLIRGTCLCNSHRTVTENDPSSFQTTKHQFHNFLYSNLRGYASILTSNTLWRAAGIDERLVAFVLFEENKPLPVVEDESIRTLRVLRTLRAGIDLLRDVWLNSGIHCGCEHYWEFSSDLGTMLTKAAGFDSVIRLLLADLSFGTPRTSGPEVNADIHSTGCVLCKSTAFRQNASGKTDIDDLLGHLGAALRVEDCFPTIRTMRMVSIQKRYRQESVRLFGVPQAQRWSELEDDDSPQCRKARLRFPPRPLWPTHDDVSFIREIGNANKLYNSSQK
ncbi:hypothetical protein BJ742DRAFT_809044 [Cladochytrium replicatum]|nr:hypothetical protein BJ742DRAFT_809044 [Cladochytrium replicatum]